MNQTKRRTLVSAGIVFCLTCVILMITVFWVVHSLNAQKAAALKKFEEETVEASVFKNLREYSTLPIDVESIETGRENPFISFDQNNNLGQSNIVEEESEVEGNVEETAEEEETTDQEIAEEETSSEEQNNGTEQ
jgi:cytoskeletal protein RodZ